MESQAETDIASELLPPSLEEQQQEEQQEDAVSEGRRYPFTIVTAASGNHFCALESMLYTLRETRQYVKEEEFPRIVVYDLGITPKHKAVLDNLYALQYFDELVQFEFDKYPTFWDITVERGQYAWKTGIVKEVQEKIGGIIVWLDTGDVPNPMFLKMIPNYIRQHGFWSPRSTGFIGSKFNHLGMFKYFHARRKDYAHFENCNGAALGFDADNKQIVDQLITPWYDCGMNKRCIAPKGSSRQNHRQDQSAITFLAIRAGFQCVEYPEFHGLTIHQDDYCHQRLQTLEAMGVLSHPSFIDM
ncbi:hypothetical protein BCR43DRAFT_249731 [Syncephalastrum racemosum]|uniref:Uncharacterized protein n=1 Tax=Syncephalastrum racemosum TaxID=13706 RepID=A0A1X2HFK5_SYNRA|nr:hypothetical protein BCR43DRAFT_249731 [Syncephalastrum racemosum]